MYSTFLLCYVCGDLLVGVMLIQVGDIQYGTVSSHKLAVYAIAASEIYCCRCRRFTPISKGCCLKLRTNQKFLKIRFVHAIEDVAGKNPASSREGSRSLNICHVVLYPFLRFLPAARQQTDLGPVFSSRLLESILVLSAKFNENRTCSFHSRSGRQKNFADRRIHTFIVIIIQIFNVA